jgi:hypothetical protein
MVILPRGAPSPLTEKTSTYAPLPPGAQEYFEKALRDADSAGKRFYESSFLSKSELLRKNEP